MRFLLGLSIVVVAACGGASSSELFGEAPGVVTDDPSRTDPAPSAPSSSSPSSSPTSDEAPESPQDAGAPPTVTQDAAPDVVDSGPPPAQACSFDTECTIDDEVCNWKTDTCAAAGPIGAPCKRDLECNAGLCNWKLTECSEPAPSGTGCRRNKECASGACSSSICK
jgi:hypothetical protein